jgi:hypothetical protein
VTQPLDVTYVELRARGEDKAARDIIKALRDIQRAVDTVTKEIESELRDTTKELEREITRAGDTLAEEAADQRTEWKKTGESMGAAITEAAEAATKGVRKFSQDAVNDLRRVEDSADRVAAAVGVASAVGGGGSGADGGGGGGGGGGGDSDVDVDVGRGRGIIGGISALIRRGLNAVKSAVQDMASAVADGAQAAGRSLLQLGSTVASALGTVGSVIAAAALPALIVALIPLIFALAGALGQLLGVLLLLPGAIASLVAIFAPLIIAFQGVGTAISALASGDLEKINEAMKNLAPAARVVARELHGLARPLKEIKFAVQEAFFRPLIGDFKAFGDTVLPVLQRGLAGVARQLGEFTSALLEMLGEVDILNVIGDLFDSAVNIIRDGGPVIIDFLGIMFGVIEHALPFVERMWAALGRGTQALGEWLSEAMKTGEFEEMLEGAFDILKSLGGLIASTGRLVATLFGDFGDDGQNFIDMLADTLDSITEFLNTEQGQNVLETIASSIPALIVGIQALLVVLAAAAVAVAYFQDALIAVINWVKSAASAIGEFFAAVGSGAVDAWNATKDFFASVGEFFQGVGTWIANAWTALGGFFTALGEWFVALPGVILGFITNLPTMVADAFKAMMNQIFYNIGYGLGLIAMLFVALPGLIVGALNAFWTLVIETFTSATTWVVETVTHMYSEVVRFFAELPARVTEFLFQLFSAVVAWFTRTRDQTTSTVSSLADRVVSFFRALPGRIMEFVSTIPGRVKRVFENLAASALTIGHNIVDGIIRGIRNGASSAVNAARDVAAQILRGFKDALGIASPSRVMADQVGKMIPRGIDVGIHAESRALGNTINALTGDMVGAVNGAAPTTAGTIITFDQGAVQVIFQGVVPTVEEATQTGEAVGNGIAQTLAQRGVRTAVRTL